METENCETDFSINDLLISRCDSFIESSTVDVDESLTDNPVLGINMPNPNIDADEMALHSPLLDKMDANKADSSDEMALRTPDLDVLGTNKANSSHEMALHTPIMDVLGANKADSSDEMAFNASDLNETGSNKVDLSAKTHYDKNILNADDATIKESCSGSMITNSDGEVMGINTRSPDVHDMGTNQYTNNNNKVEAVHSDPIPGINNGEYNISDQSSSISDFDGFDETDVINTEKNWVTSPTNSNCSLPSDSSSGCSNSRSSSPTASISSKLSCSQCGYHTNSSLDSDNSNKDGNSSDSSGTICYQPTNLNTEENPQKDPEKFITGLWEKDAARKTWTVPVPKLNKRKLYDMTHS